MTGQACVDASLALMLLLPHDLTPQVDMLWRAWVRRRDAQYLAVAAAVDCELWTGDQRLVDAVKASWVRWVGAARTGAV